MAKPPAKPSFLATLFGGKKPAQLTAAEQRQANINNLLTAVRNVTPEQRAAIQAAMAKAKNK